MSPRILRSLAVMGVSLALGLFTGEIVRRWIAPPHPDRQSSLTSQTKPEGRGDEQPAAEGLSGMSAGDFSALKAALRNSAAAPGGMTRTLHELTARITAGLRTVADCARAAALLDEAPISLRHILTNLIFRRWTALDPASALVAADRLKNWQSQRQAVELVLKAWAQRDAAAALNAVVSSPPGYVRLRGLQTVLSALGGDNPAAGLQLLTQLPKPNPAALNQVLSAWSGKEPQAAWEWANAQSDPARREQAA